MSILLSPFRALDQIVSRTPGWRQGLFILSHFVAKSPNSTQINPQLNEKMY